MSDPDLRHRDGLAWRRAGAGGLLAILLLYGALAVGSASQKAVTVDELGHLPSGAYFLLSGDPRHAALNPPLVNAFSALPVLFLDLASPIEPPPASDDPFSFWENGYHFQERHRDDYLRIYDVARLVPILVVAALGVLLYAFAGRLAPTAPAVAGCLAAGFLCTSPNVIAQARLVGTDTGAALLGTLALVALRALLLRPDATRALLFGAALGLAQLGKFYALLLYPATLLIAVAWWRLSPEAPDPRRLAAGWLGAATTSLLVLNAGYLFQEPFAALDGLALASPTLQAWQGSWLGAVPLPLPGALVRAIDGQLVEVTSSLPGFLLGERFEGGRLDFYLTLLALKTPPGLVAAFGLALFATWRGARLPARDQVLLLAYPLLLLVVLSVSGGRQLGIRALTTAAPLMACWCAVAIARASSPRLYAAGAVALLATAASSLATYPDYLSYFHVFAGGKEAGHRLASEANVDIGQDLEPLAHYLREQGVDRVQLLYFGSVDPALYGIDYEVPVGTIRPGWLAVSTSLYHMAYPMYDHGRLHTVGPVEVRGLGAPVASLGGSIHVYRVAP